MVPDQYGMMDVGILIGKILQEHPDMKMKSGTCCNMPRSIAHTPHFNQGCSFLDKEIAA